MYNFLKNNTFNMKIVMLYRKKMELKKCKSFFDDENIKFGLKKYIK